MPLNKDMMTQDRASSMLGMTVLRDDPGSSVVSMVIRDDMLNGFLITHGGIVFSLADTAFAIACNEDDRVTVAVSGEIDFLKSTTSGQTLTATATRRIRRGRQGIYDVTIVDETDEVVAEFRGRCLITDRPSPVS
jgi:acyl-CoA thioesterase